eukprot:5597143-Pleurochrysis_carterae.AAC.1
MVPKRVIGRALQRSTLMEGYVGYPPRLDRMYSIGSCVVRGAGWHDNGDHVVHMGLRAISGCRRWRT